MPTPWIVILLPLAVPPRLPLCLEDPIARIAAAGRDVDRLAQLARALEVDGRPEDARAAWAAVLELDAEHAGAREGLGHHAYDGRWFETYAALAAYRREEADRMLAEHGLVRFDGAWVAATSVPFRRMGWVETSAGEWRSPRAALEARRGEELAALGWQRQDLEWIDPARFDAWRAGLWKCGEEWLATREANAFHASLEHPWRIPGEHFVVQTTLDREGAEWARWHADAARADLVRAFGVEPARPPLVVVLRDVAQYNAFAAGDLAAGRAPTEASGESSIHYAYFADAWFDASAPPEFRGTGVAYWDRADAGLAPYGQHAVRHAAAQAWAEALDPSWEAVSRAVATGRTGQVLAGFWEEKRLPRWFRYGVASYVERYFRDPHAAEGVDPWWPRAWALDNLLRGGPPRPFEEVFAFRLDPSRPEDAARLVHEAGLLVAFALDGGCAPVERAHAALRTALEEGAGEAEAMAELQGALVAHRDELLAWAAP